MALPPTVVHRILAQLDTTALYSASCVCSDWRRQVYGAGAVSQTLLRPHLAVLRARFGADRIPARLPIAAVRRLLALHARLDLLLLGTAATVAGSYDLSELWPVPAPPPPSPSAGRLKLHPQRQQHHEHQDEGRWALSASLLAVRARGGTGVVLLATHTQPMRRLATVKLPAPAAPVLALALSESHLAVLDAHHRLHVYHLLARDTPHFVVVLVYSLPVPGLGRDGPLALALAPESGAAGGGAAGAAVGRAMGGGAAAGGAAQAIQAAPLVAVLGAKLQLIHPSLALVLKRSKFFRGDAGGPAPAAEDGGGGEWILTAPGTEVGLTPPMRFAMRGRQLVLSTAAGPGTSASASTTSTTAYLGSAWANEDATGELLRRRQRGIKDGQDLAHRPHDTDALWRHYCSRTAAAPGTGVGTTTSPATGTGTAIHPAADAAVPPRGVRKWTPKKLGTGSTAIEAAEHIWDAYYIMTDAATGAVRIASVAPFQPRLTLYRRQRPRHERRRIHCGYAVFRGILLGGATRVGGYIAFSPAAGRLNVLPLERIPWASPPPPQSQSAEEMAETAGWELVRGCHDIAIGGGDILDMVASAAHVVVVFERRVVVVRLRPRGGCGGVGRGAEGDGGGDGDGEWAVDRRGRVHARDSGGRGDRQDARCRVM